MGQSKKDAAIDRVNNRIDAYGRDLSSKDFSINNRFDNYQKEFSANNMMDQIKESTKLGENKVNKWFNRKTADDKSGLASRLTSRGISGGAYYDDMLSKAENDSNQQRLNSITDLNINAANQNANIMDKGNLFDLAITKGASGVDLSNKSSEMQKYGMLLNALQQSLGGAMQYNDDTFFDDILAILNTGAQFIPKPTP
jgi:hypothetical protein